MRWGLSSFLWFLRTLCYFSFFLLFRVYLLRTFLIFWVFFWIVLLIYFGVAGFELLFLRYFVLRFTALLLVLGWTWLGLGIFLRLLFGVLIVFGIRFYSVLLILGVFVVVFSLFLRGLFRVFGVYFCIFGVLRLLFVLLFIIFIVLLII